MADSNAFVLASIIDTTPIANGKVSVTANFLEAELVTALRADANALYRSGAFVPGGLRRRIVRDKKQSKREGRAASSSSTAAGVENTTDEKTRLCDVCGLFDDAEKADASVGDRDAREDLLDLMSDLREMLQNKLNVELLENMELQYLRYPGSSDGNSKKGDSNKKGFYGRHFDHTGDDDKPHRRRVSLLLYLNEDGWNAETDGGILRAYIRTPTHMSGDACDTSAISCVQNVVPEGGKLVLFDSTSVEHEVLPTCRERWAIVGWFLMSKKTTNQRPGGKGRKKKRPCNSSEEQLEKPKKRKKKKRREGR